MADTNVIRPTTWGCPTNAGGAHGTIVVIMCNFSRAIDIVEIKIGVTVGSQVQSLDDVRRSGCGSEFDPIIITRHVEVVGLSTAIDGNRPGYSFTPPRNKQRMKLT